MFLDKIIPERFHRKNVVCGIELSLINDTVSGNYIVLRRRKNKLELIESGIFSSIEGLAQKIQKNKIPACLTVTGKEILTKKILISNNEDNPDEIVSTTFPGIEIDKFFIQFVKQENGTALITFCRKELIDSVIQSLTSRKIEVCEVLLGIPPILRIQALWGNFSKIQASNMKIELRNNCIDEISDSIDEKIPALQFGQLTIKPEDVLSFSSSFGYLTGTKCEYNINSSLNKWINKHTDKNKITFLVSALIVMAFLLATLNAITFSIFFEKNSKIEQEISYYQSKYEKVNKIIKEYSQKKKLVENAGILEKCRFSEYADKIAISVPSGIHITEMLFDPEENKDEEDSLVKFTQKQILIRGKSNRSMEVNEWLNVIKKMEFVKEASLEKFNNTNTENLPNYEILINTL